MLSVVCETYLNPFLVRTGTPIQIASKLVTLGLEMRGIGVASCIVLLICLSHFMTMPLKIA